MRRTSRALIRSLVRCSFWSGTAAMRHHSFGKSFLNMKKDGRKEATPARAVERPGRTTGRPPRTVDQVARWGPEPRFPYSVLHIGYSNEHALDAQRRATHP